MSLSLQSMIVVSPLSWTVGDVGEPTLLLFCFSSFEKARHSGPGSMRWWWITSPHWAHTTSPRCVSCTKLLEPQSGHVCWLMFSPKSFYGGDWALWACFHI